MANILQACCNLDCQSNQCCETVTGCCMYRAALTDDPATITIEDLPDQIEFFGYGILNKNDPEIQINSGFTLVYGNRDDITFNGTQPVVGYTRVDGIRRWATLIDFAPTYTDCLFAGNLENQNEFWGDTFADTYTVSSGGIAGGFTATVTRQSLCEWRGTVTLGDPPFPFVVGINYYDYALDFSDDPEGVLIAPQWVVFLNVTSAGSAPKYDLSSPEGTYTDPDGVLVDSFYVSA